MGSFAAAMAFSRWLRSCANSVSNCEAAISELGLSAVATIIQMARAGSIKGANLKTIKLGGVSATVHAMSVCAALGLNINLACKVAETSVGAATIIHMGCVAPNVNWGVSITNHYLVDDIVKNPIVISNGMMSRPTGAGHGVEVDEAQVARYTVKS